MRGPRAWLAIAALACAGLPAPAQVLYKWIDAQGKVQYSDQPPKNFKGEVTRIEPDAQPARPAAPVPNPQPAPAREAKAEEKAKDDVATRRRLQRERLAADVARARAKLEAARAALDNAGSPTVDERQVVQQHYARGTQPATPRSNCREVTRADGKKGLMCPALVPNEGYYERVRALEADVERAERELEEAERAYRRGVD